MISDNLGPPYRGKSKKVLLELKWWNSKMYDYFHVLPCRARYCYVVCQSGLSCLVCNVKRTSYDV